jgi:hypothetical protein
MVDRSCQQSLSFTVMQILRLIIIFGRCTETIQVLRPFIQDHQAPMARHRGLSSDRLRKHLCPRRAQPRSNPSGPLKKTISRLSCEGKV